METNIDKLIDKDIEEFIYLNIEHYLPEDIIKEDNIECCVCLEFYWGVKLPNCNHFICPKCYLKMYDGFISDDFYKNNPYPNHPKMPKVPMYPYLIPDENLKIYTKISKESDLKEWFVEQQEDLYECYKYHNYEFANSNMKIWFDTNELIKKYEDSLLIYNIELLKYQDDNVLYKTQIKNYEMKKQIEKRNNCKMKCPLCRA